jgi:hypothetical protein
VLTIDENDDVVPIVPVFEGPILIELKAADPETCRNIFVFAETTKSTRVVLGIGSDEIEKSIGANAILCEWSEKIGQR